MKGNKRYYVLLAALLVVLCACIPLRTIPANPSNPINTVAVLPLYNASNDIEGPQMFRELVQEQIPRWHYNAKPLAEVDQILRDQMSVTLGEQLETVTPQQVGATLGVDGLIYTYMLNFDDKITGIYNVRKVRVGMKLVDARTGRTIWAKGQGVKGEIISGGMLGKGVSAAANVMDAREGLDEFKSVKGIQDIPNLANWKLIYHTEESTQNALIMSIGGKVIGAATKSHLKSESKVLLNMLMDNMIAGPGTPGVTAVAYAAALPVPAMEPPGSAFIGFARFGEKDFTSDLVMTFTSKERHEDMVMQGKLAKGGQNFRSEIDLSALAKRQDKDAQAGFWKSASITKMSEKKAYTVYPDMKKYMEADVREGDMAAPRIEKQKVGEDVVDGHKTDKYKITVTDRNATVNTGFMWEAKDLGGFIVKVEFENKDGKGVIEFRNVKLHTPPASLFKVPEGYVRAANFIELMQDSGRNEQK